MRIKSVIANATSSEMAPSKVPPRTVSLSCSKRCWVKLTAEECYFEKSSRMFRYCK
jgi:hypothetical protein